MALNYSAKARSCRRTATVFFIAAGFFALAGIVLMIMTDNPMNLVTLTCSVIIAGSGLSLRNTAHGYDRMARGIYY